MSYLAAAFAVFSFVGGAAAVPAPALDPIPFVQTVNAERSDVTFVYFGTRDCPVCRRFVRRDLSGVENVTDTIGIDFVRSEIWSLRNIVKPGSFGQYDALQKAALDKAGVLAVPLFAVVKDGRLVDARAGDWRAMLDLAAKLNK